MVHRYLRGVMIFVMGYTRTLSSRLLAIAFLPACAWARHVGNGSGMRIECRACAGDRIPRAVAPSDRRACLQGDAGK
jgi:hypothetical protein